jgi:hypothetical protein
LANWIKKEVSTICCLQELLKNQQTIDIETISNTALLRA